MRIDNLNKMNKYLKVLSYGTKPEYDFLRNSIIRVLNAVYSSFIPIFVVYGIVLAVFGDTFAGILCLFPILFSVYILNLQKRYKSEVVFNIYPILSTSIIVVISCIIGEKYNLEVFIFGISTLIPFLGFKKAKIVKYYLFQVFSYLFIKYFYMQYEYILVVEISDFAIFIIKLANVLMSFWIGFYQLNILRLQYLNFEEELTNQNDIIRNAKQNLEDSIQYARRIQMGVFKNYNNLKYLFAKSFIMFKPRDVVAGDFYWFSEVDRYKILIIADCTGHGVPGAFMTLLGCTYLDEIVNDFAVLQPNRILGELNAKLNSVLRNNSEIEDIRDGMDIAVITYIESENKLFYSGANIPIYLIRNNEIRIIKPTKGGLGIYRNGIEKEFELVELEIEEGDKFYIATDGLQDQNGGSDNKKLLKKNMIEEFLKNSKLNHEDRANSLTEFTKIWKGNESQRDDILVAHIEF
jgi:serine phosphatase RsbU (regulator of sigma subunit)